MIKYLVTANCLGLVMPEPAFLLAASLSDVSYVYCTVIPFKSSKVTAFDIA